MDLSLVFFLEVLYSSGSTIRRIIIDDQDVKIRFQAQYLPDDFLDVLDLIIGWYDDQSAVHYMTTDKNICEDKTFCSNNSKTIYRIVYAILKYILLILPIYNIISADLVRQINNNVGGGEKKIR